MNCDHTPKKPIVYKTSDIKNNFCGPFSLDIVMGGREGQAEGRGLSYEFSYMYINLEVFFPTFWFNPV